MMAASAGAAGSGGSWLAALKLALHAEWTKLRTLPGTFWLLAGIAVVTIAVGAAVAGAFSCRPGQCSPTATGADPGKLALAGLYVGQVVAAALGVSIVGGEYSTGMIRVSLTAVPRRLQVLLSKAVLLTGTLLVAGLVGVLGSLLAGRLLLPGRGLSAANGYSVLSLANGTDVRAFLGSALYLVLMGLFALGIATAVRDSGAAIGIVLGMLFVFPIVTAVVPDHELARHLEQFSPMTAGMYVEATVGLGSLPLTPWEGLGALACWAAGALLLGGVVLVRRDA